jgi:hypothetical protein
MNKRLGFLVLFSAILAFGAFAFSTSDVVQVTFQNAMGEDVNELFFSPADTVQWGADIMNASDILANGTGVTFWVHPGDYDILAMADSGSYMASNVSISQTAKINITKKTFVPVEDIDSGARVTVSVVNKTGQTIRFLFLSPAESSCWGPDVLRKGINLTNGSSVEFNVMGDPSNVLNFDMLAVNSSLSSTWENTIKLQPGKDSFTMNLVK